MNVYNSALDQLKLNCTNLILQSRKCDLISDTFTRFLISDDNYLKFDNSRYIHGSYRLAVYGSIYQMNSTSELINTIYGNRLIRSDMIFFPERSIIWHRSFYQLKSAIPLMRLKWSNGSNANIPFSHLTILLKICDLYSEVPTEMISGYIHACIECGLWCDRLVQVSHEGA